MIPLELRGCSMQISLDEERVEGVSSSPASLLESKASHLQDLLQEKLESAFHKQTSTVDLHDIIKIASEHSPIDLAYAAPRLPAHARSIIFEHLSGGEAKVEFIVNADNSTRASVLRQISDEDVKKLIETMPPDDAVEILESISERRFRRVVELLEVNKALRIREIKKHQRNRREG